jgi:hypothetical protein
LKLKLFSETPDSFQVLEPIEEQNKLGTGSNLFLAGNMIGCDQRNKNGRWYDFESTRKEVSRYVNEMVTPGRAMGELNHPSSADVNLERACHIITELRESDDGFYGKAKVLSTPCGLILKSLINDGVSIGVSTRALGTLTEDSTKGNVVENMHLVAIDAVADPSYPKAFVNGILESSVYVLNQDGTYEKAYEDFNNAISKLPKKEVDKYLRESILKFINALG